MDYNRVVKIVETEKTSKGEKVNRCVQDFNGNEQVVRELLYRYDSSNKREFLVEELKFSYTDTGQIELKYEFSGSPPIFKKYGCLDKKTTTKYEYDALGQLIRINEKRVNEGDTEGIKEYVTVFEYLADGTKIGKEYPAQYYNSPDYEDYNIQYYDKAGHLIVKELGRVKRCWDYDSRGNMILEHWITDGKDEPYLKYEYDKRGNRIAEYGFSLTTGALMNESHYIFNEENQEILRIHKICEGKPVDNQIPFEYVVTVHNIDSADTKYAASVAAASLPQSARILLEKAAQDDPDAMAQVANNYYGGENGFPSDDYLAFYWSQKATEAYPDYDFAWEMLGRCYEFGVGTEKNIPKAIEAFRESIRLGKTDILFQLAEILYNESDVNRRSECLPLLEKAVQTQDKYAETLLGYIYLRGELQTNNRQRGIELLTKSAEHGDSQGARLLANAYLHQLDGSEQVLPYDISKAAQYFAIAVENGEESHKALCYAGPAYFFGEGVPKSMEKARKCMEALIDDADVPEEKVFDLLGCMCFEGIGGKVDFKLGEKALRRAIESKDSEISLEAMNNLGMYFYTTVNRLPEAVQLFQSAADQGNANARVNLGKAYYEGRGVSQNVETAAYYWGLAAGQGNQIAIENLKVMGTSNNSFNYETTKKRHPIRGAIIGYFVGGVIATIVGQTSPLAGWAILILAVMVGIKKG